MPVYACEWCNDEQATIGLNDLTTGDQKFIGLNCLPLFGLSVVGVLPAEVLDGALKTIGYQPTKALRDERKAAEVPEFDAGRTIGEIVESAPVPPGAESTSEPSDESADQLVDKSPDDGDSEGHVFVMDNADNTLKTAAEYEAEHGYGPPSF